MRANIGRMNPSIPQVELSVGGQIYGGWTALSIQRGIEQLSGSFTLTLTERWPEQTAARPVKPGQACVVSIDGEAVVTGYIDEVSPSFSSNEHTLSVTGRDATADLVDCAAIYASGQWKNASLARIARDLCAPFKIPVVIDPNAQALADQPFPSWNIEEGEKVFDCLQRAALLRTVLLTTNGDGKLLITRPGFEKAVSALGEGANILSGEGKFSWAERFSEYRVKGHTRGDVASKGVAKDTVISRYRPTIILAEDQASQATASERANWEKTVKIGRSNRATVTVQGWRQGVGVPLWLPNLRVSVTSPTLRVDGELLISSLTYTLDSSGSKTALELVDPRAFDMLAGIKTTRLGKAVRGKDGTATDGKKTKKQKSDDEEWSQQ